MIGNHQANIKPEQTTRQPRERKWLLPVIVVVAVLLLAVAGWAIYQSLQSPGSTEDSIVRSDACKIEHIERFNRANDPLDLGALRELRQDIEQLDDYRGSANCMYMLTMHSLSIGSHEQAQEELNRLQRLAPAPHQLSSAFVPAPMDYGALQGAIEVEIVNQRTAEESSSRWDGAEE